MGYCPVALSGYGSNCQIETRLLTNQRAYFPIRPVKVTKSAKSSQWSREPRTGVNFDVKGLRKLSIYKKSRFDIERPRSRPTNFSVYDLMTHLSRSLQYLVSTLRDDIHEIKIGQRQGVSLVPKQPSCEHIIII